MNQLEKAVSLRLEIMDPDCLDLLVIQIVTVSSFFNLGSVTRLRVCY